MRIDISTLSDYQLHRFIQQGKFVEECKREWFRRWRMAYPYYKSASGTKTYS